MFVSCCKDSIRRNVITHIDCTLPSLEEFIDRPSNLTFCKDEESASKVFWDSSSYWDNFSSSTAEFGCPVPCSQISYKITFEFYHKNKWFYGDLLAADTVEVLALYLYFGTLDAEVRIDSLDYDLTSSLVVVGGNLGLFLGFSCLSVLLALVNLIVKFKC